jgi:ribose/xylose/arabinose/galactoside ABC-type transport system permease subunit
MNVLNAVSIVSLVLEEQTTALLMEDVDLVHSSTMILSNVFPSVLMVYMEMPTLVSANYVQLVVKCVLVLLYKSVLSVESILITPLRSITSIL